MNVTVSHVVGAPAIRGALENREGFPAHLDPSRIQNLCKRDEKSHAAPV